MRFASKPNESREQIKKAGEILATQKPSTKDWDWAINLAERWRACHAYPINTFQATLRNKVKPFRGNPIVAQRLKRMSTIIEKLQRISNLSRMQDIGGIRAIMAKPDDVMRLRDNYINNRRFTHELCGEKDYINFPRSDDGYRSLHLIYKYKHPNTKFDSYNGLRIEMQFRTKKQHMWATAVETVGMLLGESLKTRQGSQAWLNFFAIASSAFAYQEKTALVPRFSHLSKKETFEELAKAERSLNALDYISGVAKATERIIKSKRAWGYHY